MNNTVWQLLSQQVSVRVSQKKGLDKYFNPIGAGGRNPRKAPQGGLKLILYIILVSKVSKISPYGLWKLVTPKCVDPGVVSVMHNDPQPQ